MKNSMQLKVVAAAAMVMVCGTAASAQCNPQWFAPPSITYPEGVNGNVLCSVIWDPDGAGPLSPALVIGGTFDSANTAGFNHIAMWDGSGWKPLHIGVNGDVRALTVDASNNTLIAAGTFANAGLVSAPKIARFSYSSGLWSAIGSGVPGAGQVNALAYDPLHNQIYLGGSFTSAGGATSGGLARITGSTYSAVGAFFGGTVNALYYNSGDATVYVGGNFTDATLSSSNMISFNTLTNAWSGMNGGLPGGGVFSITLYAEDGLNSRIVAGGSFGSIGGTQFNSIARWSGSSWSPMASGLVGTVQGLAPIGRDLYAVGSYVLSGTGALVNRTAKWSGSFWQTMGGGLDAAANTCAAYKDALYVGGNFNLANNSLQGNTTVSRITMWDGQQWSALKAAPSGPVRTMLSTGSSLLLGGAFDMFVGSGTFAHNLVTFTGSEFVAGVGIQGFNGTNGPINAILIKSNGITIPTTVVAGSFSQAGAVNASNIASYQFAGEFSPVGSGVNGEVYALASYQCTGTINQVCGTVATGNFTASGGTPTSFICRFGPGAVSLNMGTGLNAPGRALLNYSGKLLVGGSFTTAGGVLTGHLAQWDGSTWTTFNGSFVNDTIYAMTLFNGNPVIGGDFLTINGAAARKVAMWNGSSWVDMGAGIDTAVGSVTALAVHNGELYAGGYFATIGNQPSTLARWNGSSWVAVGGEVSPNGVSALASFNGALWAGGPFTRAAGAYSPYLAEYACECYANCDNSSAAPILNVNDFTCFMNNFAAGTSYANCDHSTTPPVLNVNDFTCFMNKFAVGCP